MLNDVCSAAVQPRQPARGSRHAFGTDMSSYMSSSGWLHMGYCYSQSALDMTGLGDVVYLWIESCRSVVWQYLQAWPSGALQVLLQRCRPLALRLRGVPCAVQLLLQALRPLPSCNNTNGASATRSKSLRCCRDSVNHMPAQACLQCITCAVQFHP